MIPLLRLELTRRARRWPPVAIAGAHLLLAALAWRCQPPDDPAFGDDVAGLGLPLVWLLLVTFELGRDRDLGLDALLTGALLTPRGYVAAKLAGLAVVVALYHGTLLGLAAWLSPAPARSASGLLETIDRVLPLLPPVLGVELLSTTRVPAAFVLATALGGLVVAFGSGVDVEVIAPWLGAGDPSGAWRPAVLGAFGVALLSPLAVRRAAGRPPF